MEYRKKPVIIEAVQLTKNNLLSENKPKLPVWFTEAVKDGKIQVVVTEKIDNSLYAIVHTLEGKMMANANDWIIKGIKGEFYPCKPDVFEQTYERV